MATGQRNSPASDGGYNLGWNSFPTPVLFNPHLQEQQCYRPGVSSVSLPPRLPGPASAPTPKYRRRDWAKHLTRATDLRTLDAPPALVCFPACSIHFLASPKHPPIHSLPIRHRHSLLGHHLQQQSCVHLTEETFARTHWERRRLRDWEGRFAASGKGTRNALPPPPHHHTQHIIRTRAREAASG